MANVAQVLKEKGSQVYAVTPETALRDALSLMAEKNIGAVPVVKDERLAGIFSERDFARQSVKWDNLAMTTPIKELMTKHVRYVHPSQTLEECMALMTQKRFRHLPVLDDDDETIVGLISIVDVVKAMVTKQEFLIEQLESYITG